MKTLHYYRNLLERDTLTDAEFRNVITDWLLGMDYYIVDPVSPSQANKIILEEIMHKYPKTRSANKKDKNHILWLACAEIGKIDPKKEN